MRPRPSPVLLGLPVVCSAVLGATCAHSPPPGQAIPPEDITVVRHVDRVTPAPPPAKLAGARCRGAENECTCRATDDESEREPPAPGWKRLEVRMSADGGHARLDSPTLGRLTAAGPRETCFYVDVPAGSKHAFTFIGEADRPQLGFGPRLTMTEYGPAGPYWYKVLIVECVGASARCDRDGADAWGRGLQTRKRGRLDPCGSTVVTGLGWETSGGQASRDGGFFMDLIVRFDLETKKFDTKFAPGSTECVPK